MRHPTIEKGIHMKLGVVFPQTEIGPDPAVVRDYAQAAESAGYDHLLVFDHVLGGTVPRQEAEPRPAMTENGRYVVFYAPTLQGRGHHHGVRRPQGGARERPAAHRRRHPRRPRRAVRVAST